jgi:hypothetical protein
MTSDMAGDVKLKRTQILPMVNYNKSLSNQKDSYLSLAFMGGLVGNQFDPTLMRLADQFRNGSYSALNATQQKVERNGFNYWDASTGLSFTSRISSITTYYIGLGLYHFNRPKVAFSSTSENVHLDERYVLNGGLNILFSERNRVITFADFMRQGGNRQLLAGVMYGHDIGEYYEDTNPLTLYVGSFMRVGDAVIPMVKLERKNVSMGLTYDVNVSKLQTASNWRGGFELTLVYKEFLRISSSTLDMVRCIRF